MAAKRLSSSHLARVLRDAACPLCVFDANRRVVFANSALSSLVNCPAEELAGLEAAFHSSPTGEHALEIVNALCPPANVFAGEQQSWAVFVPASQDANGLADPSARPLRAHGWPLGVGDLHQPGGAIVFLTESAKQQSSTALPTNAASKNLPEWIGLHAALQQARVASAGRRGAEFPVYGISPAIARLARQVDMLAPTATAATILGPTGAPRQALAEFLHQTTPQKKRGRLLVLDTRMADWESLQESIFSFLAAGEQASDKRIDTIFLSAIDELRMAAQGATAELITRLAGGVRVLAAVETSLAGLAANGEFDQHLAALFSPAVLQIPPLSERREDIPLTVQACVESLNALAGVPQKSGCTDGALDDLCLAKWPGDVAQLQATLAEALQLAQGSLITRADLPASFRQNLTASSEPAKAAAEPIDLEAHLAEIETELIRQALQQAKGNKTKAAELLGMTRPRFYRRLEQLGWSEE